MPVSIALLLLPKPLSQLRDPFFAAGELRFSTMLLRLKSSLDQLFSPGYALFGSSLLPTTA